MGRYYYDGKEQSSSRGRKTAKDGVIDKVVMMRNMTDTNGKNIAFLKNIINELIDVVNNQVREK